MTATVSRRRAAPIRRPAPASASRSDVREAPPAPRPPWSRRVGRVGWLAVATMLTAALATVAMHADLARGQFELDRLDAEIAERTAALESAEFRVTALRSPTRLSDAAARLGMSHPDDVTHVQVDPAIVDRVLATAPLGDALTVPGPSVAPVAVFDAGDPTS